MQLVITSAAQYHRQRTVGGRNTSGMPCIFLVTGKGGSTVLWLVRDIGRVINCSALTVGVCTYGRCQKKVPIYRLYNGTGNTVLFPFRSRLISVRLPFLSVFKPFPFYPKGSPSVLVNGLDGEIKSAWSLIALGH